MTSPALSQDITEYLPTGRFGKLLNSTPLTFGLSGARVLAIETDSGKYVLRIPSSKEDSSVYLHLLKLASDNSIAPKLEHVDEATGATVSRAIHGDPFPRVFGNPATRPVAGKSIISLIRQLHSLPTTGASIADPIGKARSAWREQSIRERFPGWALELGGAIDEAELLLARDPRLVLSHNDVNPANILWDGERAWLVDWYVAAQNHPFYDLAALCTFFELPDSAALPLLELYQQRVSSESEIELFRSLRKLIAVFCGAIIFKLVEDLTDLPSYSLATAPTLIEAYQTIARGELSPQSAQFQFRMSLALLKQAKGG